MNIFDILGIFGSFLIAFIYFYGQYKHYFLNSKLYYFINILGSSLIISSLIFSHFNIASFSIESLWIGVSLYGLYKYHVIKNKIEIFNATLYQDEFSVDNIPSKVEIRKFTKEDLGEEILFKNNNEIIPEKSGFITTFMFNGTAMLSPYAISNSNLNINSLNKIEMTKRYPLLTIDLENFNFDIKIDKILKYYIYFKNNKNGIKKEIIDYIYDNYNNNILGYLTDGISYEEKGHEGFPSTYKLMDIKEKTFKPLIYSIKNPKNNYNFVKIQLGNYPIKTKLPGIPVEIFLINTI